MAYIYNPHIAECTITISCLRDRGGGSFSETHRFSADKDGIELTNQITDTVISALHLAMAVRAASTATGEQK